MERFLYILKEKETAVESVCVKISKQEALYLYIWVSFSFLELKQKISIRITKFAVCRTFLPRGTRQGTSKIYIFFSFCSKRNSNSFLFHYPLRIRGCGKCMRDWARASSRVSHGHEYPRAQRHFRTRCTFCLQVRKLKFLATFIQDFRPN